ncbi:hypothetical protein NH454_15475 [Pseudoalteromonas sp. Ps84H-4]|nr:hypothetical protein [Pseudoalteromonas sp. Ps84H-4]
MGRSTYTRWESGNPIPSDKLKELSKLGFDINFVVTGIRSSIDENALADCVEILEEVISETKRHFSAVQKAKIIAVLYEEYTEDAQSITPEKIQRHLRLVS